MQLHGGMHLNWADTSPKRDTPPARFRYSGALRLAGGLPASTEMARIPFTHARVQ